MAWPGVWRAPAAASTNSLKDTIALVIDGGGALIPTGYQAAVRVPWNCTITGWTILSTDPAITVGSIVLDLWKDVIGSYPPTVADTITAAAKPTVTAANQANSTTLTGWTVTLVAGDVLAVNVDSVTSLLRVVLMIDVLKS